jgi:hypothetical protein
LPAPLSIVASSVGNGKAQLTLRGEGQRCVRPEAKVADLIRPHPAGSEFLGCFEGVRVGGG